MRSSSRKEFLQASAAILASTFIRTSWATKKKQLPLAFSTLGCPDWSFSEIVEFAAAHGYSGIEVRGIQRQMDLIKCDEFSTDEKRKSTLALVKAKGLRFVDLGSSANMHIADTADRKKNMDEGRNFIDLAQQLNCPYVRVFPNKFPAEQGKDITIELIAKGLRELGDYAKDKNVMVLMETHGDAVRSEDILKIMQLANHEQAGLVWDISNMWTVTKEPVTDVYKKLSKYIRHTHIKDARLVNNEPQYVLLGRGEVPIFEAMDLLHKQGYKGYYSFEWEKLWHPEIAESSVALADFPEAVNKHFK